MMPKEITYKELFELSKTEPRLQSLIYYAFKTTMKVVAKAKVLLKGTEKVDAGKLMLNGLNTMAKLEGYTLVGAEEITA